MWPFSNGASHGDLWSSRRGTAVAPTIVTAGGVVDSVVLATLVVAGSNPNEKTFWTLVSTRDTFEMDDGRLKAGPVATALPRARE